MQFKLFSCLVLAGLAMSYPIYAASSDEVESLTDVVVTATRTETPLNEIGSAVTVITAEDILARQIKNVADALRIVPGVDVIRSGGPGQQTSVFMRGANSNHTLVLIDGVEANDPSNPTGAFDFAFLGTDNIERIEVLRGAASAVYGSDAIGGVINIITKKGQGKAKFNASAEGGSYGTWKTGGGISGSTDNINYSLDASRIGSAGFPAADKNLGNLTPDSYHNTTVSGRSGIKLSEELDLGMTVRYNEGKAFIDNCGGSNSLYGCNNPNAWNTFNELFSRGFAHLNAFDGLWEQTLGLAYSRTDRSSINTPTYSPTFQDFYGYQAAYLGEKLKLDYQTVLHFNKVNTLSLGAEEEADRIQSASNTSYYGTGFSDPSSDIIPAKTMNTNSYYLQDQLKLIDRSFTTVGVRYDDNNRFGGHVTWRVNELFAINETGTRLKGSYGTGFKAPVLFQLYDPSSGNSNLKPETSINWDLGVEQDLWQDKVTSGVTYFNNKINNIIGYYSNPVNFTFISENIGLAAIHGVESFLEYKSFKTLSFRGSYTYQQAKDLDTHIELVRRPNNKANFDADYQFLEKAHAHLNVLMVGQKEDIDYLNNNIKLAGYTIVNITGSYDLYSNLQLFARIDNLFNKQYEETYGYGTSGLAGYGGIKTSF